MARARAQHSTPGYADAFTGNPADPKRLRRVDGRWVGPEQRLRNKRHVRRWTNTTEPAAPEVTFGGRSFTL